MIEALAGTWNSGVHCYPVRIFYEDTDAGGVVYHANYFKFAERARTEMLRTLGFSQDRLMREEGIALVVRWCSADLRASARLDDRVLVRTFLTGVRGASVDIEQGIMKEARKLAHLRFKIACATVAGRPARIPGALRQALAAVLSGDGGKS